MKIGGITLTPDEIVKNKHFHKCFKKKRYKRKTDAMIIVQHCEAARRVMLKTYQCTVCDGWHISKKINFKERT